MYEFSIDPKDIKLTEHKNYAFVDIKYSNEDKKILKKIKLKKNTNKFLKFYGIKKLSAELEKELNDVLYQQKHNKEERKHIIQCTVDIIKKIISTVIKNFNEESAIIDIRLTSPNTLWKIPRWHIDFPYFKNRDKPHRKFVTTLIGPSTLFHKNDKIKRKKMIDILTNVKYPITMEERLKNRKKICKIMSKGKKIEKPKKYQAGIYLVGTMKHSAFHSEPDKNKDRIFIAILPGSKKEILICQ